MAICFLMTLLAFQCNGGDEGAKDLMNFLNELIAHKCLTYLRNLLKYYFKKLTGGRMANEISGWVTKKIGPAAVPLDKAEQVSCHLT